MTIILMRYNQYPLLSPILIWSKYTILILQHPFAIKLNTDWTNAKSFIPMTSKDWNSLPEPVFGLHNTTFNLLRYCILKKTSDFCSTEPTFYGILTPKRVLRLGTILFILYLKNNNTFWMRFKNLKVYLKQ